MPFVKRRQRVTSRSALSVYRVSELLTGKISYAIDGSYDGYGDMRGREVEDFISDEMRSDWQSNRVALIEFWQSGKKLSEFFQRATPPWLPMLDRRNTLPWACDALDD
jgi:hypothetical protein